MTTTLTITRHDDPPDTMTIEFTPPLPFKGGEIALIELKEPTARQVREAERERSVDAPWAAHVAYELKLIGLVSGLNAAQLDLLPIGAANYAATFLTEFIEAGGTPIEDDEEQGPPPLEALSIEIDPPIKFMGVSYSEINLREPLASEVRKARQMMRSPGNLFESRRAQMSLITAVSELPAPVIDALPIRRLNEAGRVLSRFTIAGRKTGSN